jgi:Ca2+-binding EF-hand superfamily protein
MNKPKRSIADYLEEKNLADLFAYFDLNGDGYISPEELKIALQKMGREPSDVTLPRVICCETDSNDVRKKLNR